MALISLSVSGYSGSASPEPHTLMSGMMMNHERAEPATMMVAIRIPRM